MDRDKDYVLELLVSQYNDIMSVMALWNGLSTSWHLRRSATKIWLSWSWFRETALVFHQPIFTFFSSKSYNLPLLEISLILIISMGNTWWYQIRKCIMDERGGGGGPVQKALLVMKRRRQSHAHDHLLVYLLLDVYRYIKWVEFAHYAYIEHRGHYNNF